MMTMAHKGDCWGKARPRWWRGVGGGYISLSWVVDVVMHLDMVADMDMMVSGLQRLYFFTDID